MFIVLALSVTSAVLYFNKKTDNSLPLGAYEQKGIVTRISPNCGESRSLVNGNVQVSKEPVVCDGGGFIQIDYRLPIQYETGLTPNGFSYDITGIEVGDKVQVIFVTNSSDYPVINCEGCGVFKL